MVLSCWAGVGGVTADFAFSSRLWIFSLSCATSDLRYSSSLEGAMVAIEAKKI